MFNPVVHFFQNNCNAGQKQEKTNTQIVEKYSYLP